MSLFPPQIFSLTPSPFSNPLSFLFPIKPPLPSPHSHSPPEPHPPPHTLPPSNSTNSHIPIRNHQMPSSDSGDPRRATKQSPAGAPPPQEQEHLPCPRCDSTNTKFCYYNNYNYSQPRHFCKSCRRYWTHGGTLRDIPVGGGSRKNAKRSRTYHNHNNNATSSSSSSSVTTTTSAHVPGMVPVAATQGGGSMQFACGGDGDVKQNVNVCGGSFTSLLNNNNAPGSGFLALNGFGLGLGHGLEDMGFGLGRAGWAFPGMVDGAGMGGGGVAAASGSWQLEGGEGGFVGGDCFSWPGLAISTPGNCLK